MEEAIEIVEHMGRLEPCGGEQALGVGREVLDQQRRGAELHEFRLHRRLAGFLMDHRDALGAKLAATAQSPSATLSSPTMAPMPSALTDQRFIAGLG